HAALGMAVTLGIVWLLIESHESWDRRRAALLAAWTIVLGLLHPFNLPTLCLIAMVLGFIDWYAARDGAHLAPASIVIGVALPFLTYNALVFGHDRFWSA